MLNRIFNEIGGRWQ